jgi:hypothetical protein
VTEDEGVRSPGWVWDEVPDEERAVLFAQVAGWVEWLETAYEPWVALPACWPLHEALRVELTMFWLWHRRIMSTETEASEGVRWHHELRRSADAWRALATCTHEPPTRQRFLLARARHQLTNEHVRQAIATPAENPHRPRSGS